MPLRWSFKLSFILLVLLLLFQNCSEVQFGKTAEKSSPSNVLPELTSESGNGGVYEGKIIVLHHYIDDFTCENRKQPESILIRDSDNKWRIIKNKPDKCAYVNGEIVEGVVYNAALKQATFENRTYIVPTPYYVDASEEPNTPDINPEDGVCENINYKCSLSAAIQQASIVSATGSTIIHIPEGHYKLTKYLLLNLQDPENSVTLRGADPRTTILDGLGMTDHLVTIGQAKSVNIENLVFTDGIKASSFNGSNGSALTTVWFSGKLEVINCIFKNNKTEAAIYSVTGLTDLVIRKSQFINNLSSAVRVFGFNSLSISESVFTGSGFLGAVSISQSALQRVTVEASTFVSNTNAINCSPCSNLEINNVTVYDNETGIKIVSQDNTPYGQYVINNSTIYENKSFNLRAGFRSGNRKIILNNTIVAINRSQGQNCGFEYSPYGILATHSLFNDASCNLSGSGNLLMTDPQLGELGDYGGPTQALAPLNGSPVIDAGDNSTCLQTDQRNQLRPVDMLGGGARCDIGAVEVQ